MNVDIDIKINDTVYLMELVSPENTVAIVGIPKTGKETNEVLVNGQAVWKNGKFRNGTKGTDHEGECSEYLKFRVQSGSWKIRASNK